MNSIDSYPDELEHLMSRMEILADEAFKILRFNLVIAGLFVSAVAGLSNYPGQEVGDILSSIWILISIATWLMSISIVLIVYNDARRLSVATLYENRDKLDDMVNYEQMSFNTRYSVVMSTSSVIFFAFGVWDSFIPVDIELGFVVNVLLLIFSLSVIPIILWKVGYQAIQFTKSSLSNLSNTIRSLYS
ncbi:hypothetical protein [Natrinema salinisoli]|uniref:hypothetical protein n=1 Tax=Natrinema salinisoli TaxID=2878535 RepID=UPI001CF05D7B|nr:hypothetical protein [Natrinema salinisoli]